MRSWLKILAVLVVVLAGLVLARRLGLRSGPGAAPPVESPVATTPGEASLDNAAAPIPVQTNVRIVIPPEALVAYSNNPTLFPTNFVPAPPLDRIQWEQKIDDILLAEADTAQKGRQMLALFPQLPEEGQIEVAPHLANLTPDTNFAALATLITNLATPAAVREVFLSDLLNRPNTIKLPLLLDVVRTPDHPWAGEARNMLEMFVEQDYGNDWSAWENAVQTWLKENQE